MPSDNLLQLLEELQLCGPEEIAECEPSVRRLCHDLPQFDSVWLDALVQRRILTAWQAEVLQSGDATRLQAGPFVRRDHCGRNTWLARTTGGREQVILRYVPDFHSDDSVQMTVTQLMEQIDQIRGNAPSSIELPRQLIIEDDCAWLASRWVCGYSTDELIVRGGRLPWPVVAEIGAQMLAAVAWLETHRLQHGQITLRNTVVSATGASVLVAPFVDMVERTELTFSADLKLSDVEYTAPELVASGARANSQSELYSVGCVLWQLLTSRSTFLTADPIQRVLRAKDQDVPDVRSIVPDCPAWMARLIQSLTRRSAELRPASAQETLDRWRKHAPTGVSNTRRLLKRMPDRKRRLSQSTGLTRRGRLISALTGALMIAVFAGWGIHRGIIPLPARMTAAPAETEPADVHVPALDSDSAVSEADSGTDPSPTADGLLRMPAPDAAGVVVLQSERTYEAAGLQFSGVMHIEADGNESAVVQVAADSSWNIEARQVVLSGVQVQVATVTNPVEKKQKTRVPLLHCQCDVLSIDRSVFQSTSRSAGVRWQSQSQITGVISVSNCRFAGDSCGIHLADTAKRCELRNTLFASDASALRVDVDTSGFTPSFVISHITQVGGPAFIDVAVTSASAAGFRLEAECGESVLSPTDAVIRIAGPREWRPTQSHVAFLLPERGNPVIISPGVDPVIYFDRLLNQLVALDDDFVRADALLLAEPVFAAADPQSELARFRLIDFEGPKLSARMPGVDVTALPGKIAPETPDVP